MLSCNHSQLGAFFRGTTFDAVDFFKREIARERVISADLSYLNKDLYAWWESRQDEKNLYQLKIEVSQFLLNRMYKAHKSLLNALGVKGRYLAAVCFSNIFTIDSAKLAFVIHEAMSDLFYVNDIQYPYEEHKVLYLNSSGMDYDEWGKGWGKISPHQDDIYEAISTDYLALTVCRDTTKTPTRCYLPKDIVDGFSDKELWQLMNTKAKFISGKNVSGRVMCRECNIVQFNPLYGITFNLDFRIDKNNGQRMVAMDSKGESLLQKLRANLASCSYVESVAKTGTFFIVANHKVLHSRAALPQTVKGWESKQNHFGELPSRLLYRSKGNRKSLAFDDIAKFH